MRDGLTVTPPIMMRPFLQASAAMLRVLKMRVAHIHLSMRTSFMALSFVVVLVHRQLDAGQAETLDDLGSAFQLLGHQGLLFGGEPA